MRISKFISICALALTTFSVLAATDFEDLILRAIEGDADAARQLTNARAGWGSDNGQATLDRYHASSEQGEALAAYRLSIIYRDGLGVPADSTESLRQLKLAAERGHPAAMTELALRYEFGKAGTIPSPLAILDYFRRDDEVAATWLMKAASLGHPPALVELGRYHLEGKGGLEKNQVKGLRLLEQAAQGGYAPAQYSLGTYYARQTASPDSERNAVQWFSMAASQAYEIAFTPLEALAAKGNQDAHKSLARIYGQPTQPSNRQILALNHLQAAANRGDPEALFMLGQLAERGERLPNQALDYFREAARMEYQPAVDHLNARIATHDLDALHTMASLRLETGSFPEARARAIEMFQDAAKQGHVPSLNRLVWLAEMGEIGQAEFIANLYERGIGVEKSSDRALSWWKTSANQKSALGLFRLAQRLEAGAGTPTGAAHQYGEAYRLGNTLALFPLERLAQGGLSAAQKILADVLMAGFTPGHPASWLHQATETESLAKFSRRSGMALPELLTANPHFEDDSIFQAGDILLIPATSPSLNPSVPNGYLLDSNGRGSEAMAIALWKKASDQGLASATLSLARVMAAKGDSAQAMAGYRLAVIQGDDVTLSWLQKAADQHELLAINTLAKMYLEGEGVHHDVVKGWQLLEQAAKLGDISATVRLARRAHERGQVHQAINGYSWAARKGNVEAADALKLLALAGNRTAADAVTGLLRDGGNPQALTDWLTRLAALGDPNAAFEVAQRLMAVPGGAQSAETLALLKKAADAGNASAQLKLAQIFENPLIGLTANLPEAIVWYAKAAGHGKEEAVSSLQRLKHGASGELAYMALAHLAAEAGHQPEASRLYLAAANRGHLPAYLEVASRYEKGIGLIKDATSAYTWNLQAAQMGHAAAQWGLAMALYTGDGVEADTKAALEWFKRSGSQGDKNAALMLGYLIETGEGVDANLPSAIEWYTLSAQQGVPEAQSALGRIYRKGVGVPADYGKALEWYEKAAKQEEASAGLGWMHEQGLGVPANGYKAIDYFQRAANKGLADAHYRLARLYLDGKVISKQQAEAVRHMEKAAEANDPAAQFEFGLMYLKGSGVRTDDKTAADWLRKAALQHHAGAQLALAEAHVAGTEMGVDDTAAFKLANCLAENNAIPTTLRDRSRMLLGDFYETGRGVEVSMPMAHCWYNLAAANAQPGAEEARSRVEADMDGTGRRLAERCAREHVMLQPVSTKDGDFIDRGCTGLLREAPWIEAPGLEKSLAIDRTTIRVPLLSNHYHLRVRIGRTGYQEFMVDTGATALSICESDLLASEVSYRVFNDSAFARLANGEMVRGETVLISEIEVEGIKLEDIRAFVSEQCSIGLLGQSVLSRFDLRTTKEYLEMKLRK